MFLRDLKRNYKGFILWTISMCAVFLIVFLVYPSLISPESKAEIDTMLKLFPKELLSIFNMDTISITNVFGWLETEGFTFYILIGCIYSSILGSNLLKEEESSGTIDFLLVKPITRNSILNSKILVGLFYIFGFTLVVSLFNLLGLYFSDVLEVKKFLLLYLSPILVFISTFFLTMTLTSIFNIKKSSSGLAIGFTLLSYMISIISSLSSKLEVLKYSTVFSLVNSKKIITSLQINMSSVSVTILIVIICYIILNMLYSKKDFS